MNEQELHRLQQQYFDNIDRACAEQAVEAFVDDARWRFHERKVRQLYAMPMAELPRGLAKPLRKRWPGAAPAAADLPPADVLTQSSGH